MMRRILGEPLLQFAVLGVLLFVSFRMLGDPRNTAPQRVVVTTGQIERLAETWRRTWQRAPTRAELDGLVEDYVREEILYREALALGLDRGAGGMRLWPLFGTTNQLLAGLSLLVLTLFLLKLGRNVWVTAVPMVFLLFMTTWAMILNLVGFVTDDQVLLTVVGGTILVLELWLLFEGAAAFRRHFRDPGDRADIPHTS